MDYVLQSIFKQIYSEVVCRIAGNEIHFSCGDEAIAQLQKEKKHYSPINISACGNVVVVEIQDIAEDIHNRNEKFIAEHKKQFGHEPSFVD